AHDLRARPWRRVLRYAGCAHDRSRCLSWRFPLLVDRLRHRRQRAVPDEEGPVTFVAKTALPRRTFLRGAGATLALPLLDAMVPALTALAKSPAAPVRRIGFVYLANGVAMNDTVNFWRPTGIGPALEP